MEQMLSLSSLLIAGGAGKVLLGLVMGRLGAWRKFQKRSPIPVTA